MKAQEQKRSVAATSTKSDDMKKLLEQYGCGPVQLTGTTMRSIDLRFQVSGVSIRILDLVLA
jgi:hypothetical protein